MRTKLLASLASIGTLALLVKAYERWFFPRDPARTVDPHAKIVSPADGRIVYAANVEEGRVPIAIKGTSEIPLRRHRQRTNSPTERGSHRDLHVTFRCSLPAQPDLRHRRRGFLPPGSAQLRDGQHVSSQPLPDPTDVRSLAAHLANERNIVHITGPDQDAYVVQIADQQVNKIDCYVQTGDQVAIGQKIGMIRRGSQVDLFLPGLVASDLPHAAVGQRVQAGASTLLERSGI